MWCKSADATGVSIRGRQYRGELASDGHYYYDIPAEHYGEATSVGLEGSLPPPAPRAAERPEPARESSVEKELKREVAEQKREIRQLEDESCQLAILIQVRDQTHQHRWHVLEYRVLSPGENDMGNVTVNVGHQVQMALVYLDQNGQPMLTTPTPDAAPTWTDAPAPAGDATLAVGAGGLTAVDTAVAPGTDLVTVSLAVGGVAFSATLGITISPAPQVLTSIAIAPTVV